MYHSTSFPALAAGFGADFPVSFPLTGWTVTSIFSSSDEDELDSFGGGFLLF